VEEVMGTPLASINEQERAERSAIPYPVLELRPGWGDRDSVDRAVVDRLISSLPPAEGVEGIAERINVIAKILEDCKRQCQITTDVQEALANILILEAISALVHRMHATPGGRGEIFESFLAAIIGVSQMGQEVSTTKTLADIGGGISAKYFGGMSARPIKGALDLLQADETMDYVIALAPKGKNYIEFYYLPVSFEAVMADVKRDEDGTLRGSMIDKSDPTQFSIPISGWRKEANRRARLDLGSPKEIREVARQYLNGADIKLVQIYDSLNQLTNQLDRYFIEGDSAASTEAQKTLQSLQEKVVVLA
jgi:hypothetical protein